MDDAADVALDGAPAAAGGDDALRQRLVASQQQCRKLEQRLAEKAELCAEKDAQIAAVLEEGEQLSKRQLDQEKTIRALRQSLREAQTATELAEAEVESLREGHEASERQRSEALAERTKQAAAVEGELGGALSIAQDALAAERDAAAALRTRVAALEEEAAAASAAAAAAGAREASATEAVRELQEENERLGRAQRMREEGLQLQLSERSARRRRRRRRRRSRHRYRRRRSRCSVR